ncbi:hypothetical protein HMPREF0880_03382 [Yokenella regensburgei ATCC 43003]|nr:hypothetical protein HMPREF0880_03382 [Yokenella regensburgei ATCC 43003]
MTSKWKDSEGFTIKNSDDSDVWIELRLTISHGPDYEKKNFYKVCCTVIDSISGAGIF